jgi:hypothetical protein
MYLRWIRLTLPIGLSNESYFNYLVLDIPVAELLTAHNKLYLVIPTFSFTFYLRINKLNISEISSTLQANLKILKE